MFKLNRWPNTWMQRDFRNDTNQNWQTIEQGLNFLELLNSKTKEELDKRIDNLIIHDGQSDAEVIDMRIDMNGKVYDLAGKRVAAIEKDLAEREINVGALRYLTDTAAIQTALDSAKMNGRASILIPGGIYRITQTLVIYANTHIRMDNNTIILRAHSGNIMMNGEKGAEYSGYNGNGNITIEGGILDGNVKEFYSGFTQFDLARADNVNLKDVTFKDTLEAHAIDMNACKNVSIKKCRFIGYKVLEGSDGNPREAIQIAEHTKDGFPAFGMYDATPCLNITVEDCFFGNSGTEGMNPWPVGVGHHAGVHDVFNKNIKVFKCILEGMTYAGVRIMKYQDTLVKDNTFTGCKIGILVTNVAANSYSSQRPDGSQSGRSQAGKNAKIKDNTFRNCENECVRISSYVQEDNDSRFEDIIISDNTCENDAIGISKTSAIAVTWGRDVKIKGNTIKNFYRGVHLNFVGNANIEDNTFDNLTTEAVFVNEFDAEYRKKDHTYDIKVKHNRISRTGRAAIFIQYADGLNVSSNKIYSPSLSGHGDYNGIFISNTCKNGIVENNEITNDENGIKPRYAVEVSGSCIDIRTLNNKGEGVLGKVITSNVNNFEGMYLHSTSGTERIQIGYSFFNSFKWIDAVLQNGTTAYSTGLRPQFGKDEFGTVYLRGATKDGALGQAFFTLPEGFRPTRKQNYIAVKGGTNTIARITITENGEVVVESTSNSEKPLDYIVFDFSFKAK
ncbi:right-handed parallel beta-helix repeat-containing protein [Bacillus sp. FSL R10-2780]|uniref:right-handed parallel beta-helix repeat-containing protein n=1 Tax=Bacillus sp. FSL R10-2780 TaxID=2954660 RepID=UPI0030FB7E13